MLPVPSGSETKIIGNVYCIHFFVNNLPIHKLNFHGFVYRQTELISSGKCKYMDIVGFREYYLRDLLQLVLVSILIVHNQIHCISHF